MVFLLIFLGTLYYFIVDILDAGSWNGLQAIAYFQYWSVIGLCLKDKIRHLCSDVVDIVKAKTLSVKAMSQTVAEFLDSFSFVTQGADTGVKENVC